MNRRCGELMLAMIILFSTGPAILAQPLRIDLSNQDISPLRYLRSKHQNTQLKTEYLHIDLAVTENYSSKYRINAMKEFFLEMQSIVEESFKRNTDATELFKEKFDRYDLRYIVEMFNDLKDHEKFITPNRDGVFYFYLSYEDMKNMNIHDFKLKPYHEFWLKLSVINKEKFFERANVLDTRVFP